MAIYEYDGQCPDVDDSARHYEDKSLACPSLLKRID